MGDPARFMYGEELEYRVDLHELDARSSIDLLSWHDSKRNIQHAVGGMVSIMARIAKQSVVAAKQAEIHAPGIDAYSLNLFTIGCNRHPQTMFYSAK